MKPLTWSLVGICCTPMKNGQLFLEVELSKGENLLIITSFHHYRMVSNMNCQWSQRIQLGWLAMGKMLTFGMIIGVEILCKTPSILATLKLIIIHSPLATLLPILIGISLTISQSDFRLWMFMSKKLPSLLKTKMICWFGNTQLLVHYL